MIHEQEKSSKGRRRSGFAPRAILASLALLLAGADYTWTGSTNRNWTGANWLPGGYPDGTDDTATIDNTANEPQVKVNDVNIDVGRLLVGNGHTLHLKESLTVGSNSKNPTDTRDGRVEFEGEVTLDTEGSSGDLRQMPCHFVRISTDDSTLDTVVEFAANGDSDGLLITNGTR